MFVFREEYINYDLVFRSDKEVLHTEHVLKDALGSADSDGYYTIDHYVSYPSELRDRYSEITDVTVENVEVWSQEGPKIAFILLTVAAGAATIVIIAVAAATRKRGAENK